ncbi:NAD(P)H-dependent oxidoreductase [Streptomyces sp. SID3343]|uniref:NADPH-dependent FMN reductase n=1 Tax=Streptomyces sp. SID3343 TaxID=2690260 RepID=UPI00136B2A7A|nr:NAD(P)H-dependent oxidoreductase [Streptomyces sp. SID3343]MYW04008.1 NADPH-dependent FMN reductase [Streptomyces sp. SID3343]
MIKVGIVIASTRPGRVGEDVGRWVLDVARRHAGAHYELVDLRDYDLPQLDEPIPALMGGYSQPHTIRWANKVGSLDAFVFVTPEYNHGVPGALKNALDFVYAEWVDKAAGFVGYGMEGAGRAIAHLRNTMAALGIADVRHHAALLMHHDFVDFTKLAPQPHQEDAVVAVLDDVIAWGTALRPLRQT